MMTFLFFFSSWFDEDPFAEVLLFPFSYLKPLAGSDYARTYDLDLIQEPFAITRTFGQGSCVVTRFPDRHVCLHVLLNLLFFF